MYICNIKFTRHRPSRLDTAKFASFVFVLILQCVGACSGVVYSIADQFFPGTGVRSLPFTEMSRLLSHSRDGSS
jgi:hypothetical protein